MQKGLVRTRLSVSQLLWSLVFTMTPLLSLAMTPPRSCQALLSENISGVYIISRSENDRGFTGLNELDTAHDSYQAEVFADPGEQHRFHPWNLPHYFVRLDTAARTSGSTRYHIHTFEPKFIAIDPRHLEVVLSENTLRPGVHFGSRYDQLVLRQANDDVIWSFENSHHGITDIADARAFGMKTVASAHPGETSYELSTLGREGGENDFRLTRFRPSSLNLIVRDEFKRSELDDVMGEDLLTWIESVDLTKLNPGLRDSLLKLHGLADLDYPQTLTVLFNQNVTADQAFDILGTYIEKLNGESALEPFYYEARVTVPLRHLKHFSEDPRIKFIVLGRTLPPRWEAAK